MMIEFILLLSLAVGQWYQVPDDWKGCFVNPDDLNDTTFGCSGPTGSAEDARSIPDVSEIQLTMSNGTVINLVFKNGTVELK